MYGIWAWFIELKHGCYNYSNLCEMRALTRRASSWRFTLFVLHEHLSIISVVNNALVRNDKCIIRNQRTIDTFGTFMLSIKLYSIYKKKIKINVFLRMIRAITYTIRKLWESTMRNHNLLNTRTDGQTAIVGPVSIMQLL